MPHIVAKRFQTFSTPLKVSDFHFLWWASPLRNAKDTLVALTYEKLPFLLEIKPKDDKKIIKPDKITRPPDTTVVKQALKRFCNLAKCEILYDNLSYIKPSHASKAKEFFKDIDFFLHNFPKEKEIWIEIGFGSGRHLLYQAKEHPDILFIGIEIHKPSIEQLLKQIALQKRENILVVDYDARLFLEFVPSNVVGRIFVHFPVPWDKKPHRRVISKPFIQEAKRVLRKGGVLELRTDSKNYFDYAFDLFMAEEQIDLEVTKNMEPPIASKYEQRWMRLGKDIYDIRMKGLHLSAPKLLDFDFTFAPVLYDLEKIAQELDLAPKVFENFFIHFQKVYSIDKEGILLEVSFGSFDRPEHRYIVVKQREASYFPKKPLPIQANIEAHKKIEEMLHG